jgi:hypothetical protein
MEEIMVWVNVKSKGLNNIPGFPEVSNIVWDQQRRALQDRKSEFKPAKDGLTREYSLGAGKDRHKLKAEFWLYGDALYLDAWLGTFSLEDPRQFMISCTSYENQCDPGADDLLAEEFAKELTDDKEATRGFWPRIAKFGTGYNLLGILRQVTETRLGQLRTLFDAPLPHRPSLEDIIPPPPPPPHPQLWEEGRFKSLQESGRLYEIDLSLFGKLPPRSYPAGGVELLRYNPGTLTLLEMTDKKELLPVLIRVSNEDLQYRKESSPSTVLTIAARSQIYSPKASTQGAWLYALQAVKTSVTLYGIWLGHVYHWHLVPAAMVRTMNEAMRDMNHPVQRLFHPHSEHLIEFNYFLLSEPNLIDVYGQIAPPTSLAKAVDVLKLEDTFAKSRSFFDDDPKKELENNGILEANFTAKKPWDLFPAAQNLLRIWDICENLIKAFVSNTYADDAAVVADKGLQTWKQNASKTDQGNIRGLEDLKSRDALTRLLTSQLYRLTAHGVSRLPRSTDPWLAFVANFPPCLQRIDFPAPDTGLNTQELLKYLPNVRTIADTVAFYFAFAYSKPYTSLIPEAGLDKDLPFPKGTSDPRNKAVIEYRTELQKFMEDYTAAQLPPGYKKSSEPKPWLQWPRSIET